MTTPIQVRGLSAGYRRNAVFSSIDLDIGTGVTGLLGPNGAGKTTLLHLFCGLRKPSAGTLRVMDVDASSRTARRMLAPKVGFLPQSVGYFPSYTVRDFVSYAAWLKRVPAKAIPGQVDSAVEDVGLSARASSQLRSLSGGMLRRVGIAAALVHRPDLLILDEPASGLDPEQRVDLRSLIGRMATRTVVILSTHLIEDVAASCDAIVVLDRGTPLFVGTRSELARLGGAKEADAPGLERGYLTALRPLERA